MVEAVFTIMMSIAIILEIVLLFVNISILIATIIGVKKGREKRTWVTKRKPKAKQNKGPTVLK
jgi:hypothetical protein